MEYKYKLLPIVSCMLHLTKQCKQVKEKAGTCSPLAFSEFFSALEDACKSESTLGNEIAVDNEACLSTGQQKCTFSLRQARLLDDSVLECILCRQERVEGVCLEGTGSFAHFLFVCKKYQRIKRSMSGSFASLPK